MFDNTKFYYNLQYNSLKNVNLNLINLEHIDNISHLHPFPAIQHRIQAFRFPLRLQQELLHPSQQPGSDLLLKWLRSDRGHLIIRLDWFSC